MHMESAAATVVFRTIEKLAKLNDLDAILDTILHEARAMSGADAGSIFLVEDGRLAFRYVHNDTLFDAGRQAEAVYADFSVAVDENSIVGYAALAGRTLAIDDAYALDAGLPYRFNPDFDSQSGYRTISILAIPLMTFERKVVGVMQLINATDDRGRPAPFSGDARRFAPFLAGHAALAVERGLMTRELVLRMMKMAELRDPGETGAHVQRVGAYAAEIYRRWAENAGLPEAEVKHQKDLIRLAAMLHDAGKVGVCDSILKKPGRLNDEEFEAMKRHAVHGARLFIRATSELDRMCYDIALGHHERWDGRGYPGHLPDIGGQCVLPGRPLKGGDVPIAARITALADVYDALSSKRCYKEAWPRERVLETIRDDSGKAFDPEVVRAFFDIQPTIEAIGRRFA